MPSLPSPLATLCQASHPSEISSMMFNNISIRALSSQCNNWHVYLDICGVIGLGTAHRDQKSAEPSRREQAIDRTEFFQWIPSRWPDKATDWWLPVMMMAIDPGRYIHFPTLLCTLDSIHLQVSAISMDGCQLVSPSFSLFFCIARTFTGYLVHEITYYINDIINTSYLRPRCVRRPERRTLIVPIYVSFVSLSSRLTAIAAVHSSWMPLAIPALHTLATM